MGESSKMVESLHNGGKVSWDSGNRTCSTVGGSDTGSEDGGSEDGVLDAGSEVAGSEVGGSEIGGSEVGGSEVGRSDDTVTAVGLEQNSALHFGSL